MNKLFKTIGAISLGLAMAAGVAVGASSKVESSFATGSSTSFATKGSFSFPSTQDGITLSCAKGSYTSNPSVGSTYTKVYSGNILTITPATGITLTQIKLTATNNDYIKTWSSSSGNVSVSNKYATWSGSSLSAISLTNTASAQARINEIEVTFTGQSKKVTDIALKTAQNKSYYLSGESFDPTGLVITATYDSGSPEDIAYADDPTSFTFSPSTITETGNVTITYSEKTCTTAVNLVTVVDITGVKTAPTQIGLNETIPVSSVILNATLNNSETTTVTPTSIVCDSSVTGNVVATATYEPATGVKTATFNVTVVATATYDLSKIDGFSEWTSTYGSHDVTSADVGSSTGATMNFKITNKQSSGVGSEYPCIATKTNVEVEALKFTLTKANTKISSVSITFVQRGTNKPSFYLHKGAGIETSVLATLDINGEASSEQVLSYSNVNDTVFTVGYNGKNTGSNVAAGIKSITIGLSEVQPFGTLDHIKVAQNPSVMIYHVGESVSYAGIKVNAYDNADESVANFEDVTASVTYSVTEGTKFTDEDIPSKEVTISYSGKDTSLTFSVYAAANYKLVESEPTDWSGSYLIVGSYQEEVAEGDPINHTVAMNSTLNSFDAVSNFKEVTPADDVIASGQECEFKVAAYNSGYSIQGKSGKYFAGLSTDNNGLTTSDTALENAFSFDATSGDVLIKTGSRHLRISYANQEARFRYYKDGSGVKLYKLVESSKAGEYADKFLSELSCDGTGTVAPSTSKWGELNTAYAALSNSDKQLFKLGVASESGTNIQKCLARYDYVVAKYGKAVYADFMDRNPVASVSSLTNIHNENSNSSTSIIVIVAIAMASVTGLGVLLALKRRKGLVK